MECPCSDLPAQLRLASLALYKSSCSNIVQNKPETISSLTITYLSYVRCAIINSVCTLAQSVVLYASYIFVGLPFRLQNALFSLCNDIAGL